MIKPFLTLTLLVCSVIAVCQTVNLNFPAVDNALRRAQLSGIFQTNASFALKPLYSTALRIDTLSFLPEGLTGTTFAETASGKSYVKILPVQWNTEYNSHHPYGWNNGAMIRARGTQTLVSAGVYAKWGLLSLQLQPEFVFASNRDFEGFPDTHSNSIWRSRYRVWNGVDVPERFGNERIFDFLPGQSSLRVSYKAFTVGVSTENIWWGPGKENSLIMTNNARGFQHLTFNSTQPAKTPIGSFEWQLVVGRLENSNYDAPLPDRIDHKRWIAEKIDDWRYLNGLNLIYSPKWISGLSLGFSRVVQNYHDSVAHAKSYLPVFSNLLRENDKNQYYDGSKDQIASFFMRWFWDDADAEIYFEVGRSDASWNLRDFLMSPEHSRAYITGVSKLIPLPGPEEYFEINLETTHLELSKTGTLRAEPRWYWNGRTKQGYTNKGEIIGSGIGPGSNVQNLSISWVKQLKKVGLQFERLVNDNDFYYQTFGIEEYKRNWTDVSIGLLGSWNWDHFLFDSKIQFIHSNNYQWEVSGDPDTPEDWVGKKANNLYLSSRLAYLF